VAQAGAASHQESVTSDDEPPVKSEDHELLPNMADDVKVKMEKLE
jgi:hypothetical protein